MITAFITGLACGFAISISAAILVVWLIDVSHEGGTVDKRNVK